MAESLIRQVAAPLEEREFIEMVNQASYSKAPTSLGAFMWHRPDGQVDVELLLIWNNEMYQADGGTHGNTYEAYVEVRSYKRAAAWTRPVQVKHHLGYRAPTSSQVAAQKRNAEVHLEVEHNVEYEA